MQNSSQSSSKAITWTRTVYFYIVIAGVVLSLSISGFVLLRRVAIDLFFPNLENRYSIYQSDIYPDCRTDPYYNKPQPVNNQNSSSQASEDVIKECENRQEKEKRENENRAKKQQELDRAEQYLYSILSIFITLIILITHLIWIRPKKEL